VSLRLNRRSSSLPAMCRSRRFPSWLIEEVVGPAELIEFVRCLPEEAGQQHGRIPIRYSMRD